MRFLLEVRHSNSPAHARNKQASYIQIVSTQDLVGEILL